MASSIDDLKKCFKTWNLSSLSQYMDIISSRNAEKIFPPYVPLVGSRFEEYGLLIYGTAQNLKPDAWQLKEYAECDDVAVDRLRLSFHTKRIEMSSVVPWCEVDIAPYQGGVLPALAGIFLLKVCGVKETDFQAIQEQLSLSNYYKFSLRKGKKDINPNSLPKSTASDYWKLNDSLVKKELGILKPKHVITFRGRHLEELKRLGNDLGFKAYCVNDPSWILRGGGGCLKPSGSWGKRVSEMSSEPDVCHLIEKYLGRLDKRYNGKKDGVKAYLAHYWKQWS